LPWAAAVQYLRSRELLVLELEQGAGYLDFYVQAVTPLDDSSVGVMPIGAVRKAWGA
jgi:hypothetical protein